MKGRLKDRPLEILLHEFQVRSRTGVLTLERSSAKKQICLVNGTVRFAASNLLEDRLAEFLVRYDLVPPETVREVEAKTGKGHRLAESLVSSGLVSLEQIHSLARAHILDLVLPCYEWRTGEYRFEEGVPNIVGEFVVDIPAVEFTLEKSRRSLPDEAIAEIVAKPARRLALSGFGAKEARRLSLTQMEMLIVARAEEGESVGETLAVAPAMRADLTRALAVLAASGVVTIASEKAATAKGAASTDAAATGTKKATHAEAGAPDGDAAVRYYKQMHDVLIGADFYKTLGVDTNVTPEEVRRSYYTLAKEIHPDRFLSPPLDVLHQDMEELFAQVLEAYNTLFNPDSRSRYDAERASKGATAKQPASDQAILAKQNYLRGKALTDEGKPAEALKFLQNAVELEPNRPEYLRLLGTVQAKNPRLRMEAEATLLKAIELDPARADGYLQLGMLYRRMGDIEKSIERLRECLKWDPTNGEAGTALAEMTRTVGHRS